MTRSKFFQLLLCFFSLININLIKAQNISVDTSLNAQQLVDKFIGAQNASCITVSNVSISGWNFGGNDTSYGYFSRNGSSFEIDEGIILSTGKAKDAEGPNSTLQSNFDSNWPAGDPDLVYILSQAGLPTDNILNATYLEFDFVSLQSDKISFDYMFLSEEYRDSNCRYSDAFAFLIKEASSTDPYQNIALVPGTNTPVTSLSINGAKNCPRNVDYFGGFSGLVSPTNFNGQTKVLKANATVKKGVTYHIKLVIADHGDANGLYDSAVFLKSGSFTGNINIGNDLTIDNADPLCENVRYRIQPNPIINDPSAKYTWFKNGVAITSIPPNQSYYDVVNEEGDFSVEVTLGSGCRLEGYVKIEKVPVAVLDTTPIPICDDNFDGKYSAVLSNFNTKIVTNFSRDFSVSYHTSPTSAAIDPDKEFVFTTNPQTLYVKVSAFACAPKTYAVQFYNGIKLSMSDNLTFDICDNDRSNSEDINLANYLFAITSETGYNVSYFATEAQAKSGGASTINNLQIINSSKSFYIRIEKSGACANYVKINLRFKQPRKSSLLPEEPIMICKAATTNLQVETGFDYYEWSTGVKGQFANEITNVPAGNYWVKLTSNGCVYQQYVQVKEAENPIIDNVLIQGSTITIQVSGGTKPYQYALDNGNYQSSNVFNNVTLGNHTVYVQGKDGCAIVSQNFSLINTQNVITPNQDGANDVIDYSSLSTKLDPRLEIYDRNGVLIFKGDSNNQFIWDGKQNGRVLPTASYWYILEWNEVGNPERTRITGWILLKNRN